MKYNPGAHDLGYVIRDLDARAERLEAALQALLHDVAYSPSSAAKRALAILNGNSAETPWETQRDPGDENDYKGDA